MQFYKLHDPKRYVWTALLMDSEIIPPAFLLIHSLLPLPKLPAKRFQTPLVFPAQQSDGATTAPPPPHQDRAEPPI